MTSAGVVLAAGEGNRFHSDSYKQLTELHAKPVLQYSLELFDHLDSVSSLIVVGPPENLDPVQSLVNDFDPTVSTSVIPGGASRFDSVKQGLNTVDPPADTAFFHDAARPGASGELCEKLLDRISRDKQVNGVIPVINIPDTVKRVSGETVEETLDRSFLRRAQTPQLFRVDVLREAVGVWDRPDPPTDEAELLEQAGYSIESVPGEARCRKLTYPEDLRILEALLPEQTHGR